LLTGATFELKIHQNVFAAGALPRTPLGELTELPQTLGWFSGDHFGEEERRGERREGGKGNGSVPHFFFTI